jgi:arylsulfatase A-like enzyme
MMLLASYQMEGTGQFAGTTHFSPWSYDRHVPLAIYGTPFLPGEYHQRVAPVDLAVTFASLAGVNQPSAAVGRVLTEAIKSTRPAPAQ